MALPTASSGSAVIDHRSPSGQHATTIKFERLVEPECPVSSPKARQEGPAPSEPGRFQHSPS